MEDEIKNYDYILKCVNLTKRYAQVNAVDNVSINVKKGDVYGFIGENGAGKTTIIRLITGLINPTSGYFEMFGIKNTDSRLHEAKKKLGAIVEAPSIYLNMTAEKNLELQATLLGLEGKNRIGEVLETVGLGYLKGSKKHAKNFSLGMRQRLGIGMALLGNPDLLILDEPINGLDPSGIVEVRELIKSLSDQGITIIISSHILDELAKVATKFGFISHGKIIKEITKEELVSEARPQISVVLDSLDGVKEMLDDLGYDYEISYNKVIVYGNIDLNDYLDKILKLGNKVLSVNSIFTNDIESYYMKLIGGAHNA